MVGSLAGGGMQGLGGGWGVRCRLVGGLVGV